MRKKLKISLSSNHAKRMARLRQAEEKQHQGYKIADIIRVMETPMFAKYFGNEFQTYLKCKEDVLTTGDQQNSEDAYLDVVTFLDSMLRSVNNIKTVEVGERDGLDNDGIHNPRMGNRKGISYTVRKPGGKHGRGI